MSIILSALLIAQVPQVGATPSVEQEIVVIGKKLKKWRGKAAANGRGSRCRTTQSTGNSDLDQIACDSLRFCMIRVTPEMVAASDRKIAKPVRELRLAALNRQLEACGSEQHRLRVTDWVERRAAARTNDAQD